MRETIKDWKEEWIETNGETNELEVIIDDSSLSQDIPYIYEGSFAKIPDSLELKKVLSWGKILDSSIADRIGAYRLTI